MPLCCHFTVHWHRHRIVGSTFLKTFKTLFLNVKTLFCFWKETNKLTVNFSRLLSHSFNFFNICTLKTEIPAPSCTNAEPLGKGLSQLITLCLCFRRNARQLEVQTAPRSVGNGCCHYMNNIQLSIWLCHPNMKMIIKYGLKVWS